MADALAALGTAMFDDAMMAKTSPLCLGGSPHKHRLRILLGLPYKEILGAFENLWIFNRPSCFHRCPGLAMMIMVKQTWPDGKHVQMVEMKKYRDNMGQIGTIPYLNRKIHRLRSPLRQSLWIATPFNLGNLNSTLRDVKVMSCDGI